MIAPCPELSELEEYLSGGADPPSAGSIDRHLSTCDGCRRRLAEIRTNLEAVGAIREALATSSIAAPGQRIGKYRIIAEIGRGGMGVVYRAQQDNPQRSVALKVLNGLGGDDRHRRLFQREALALARLQHPGIAALYEADCTGGVPFLVMELVEGDRLTTWAVQQRLSIRRRLSLFARICAAVSFAHQRGVIHRDLKPSNILVDAGGEPRILDFGMAKILEHDGGTPGSALTEAGRILGTLPYMSPEQVRGDAPEIDTRTDLYALGVVLYELLTGQLPYDLGRTDIVQAARIIGEAQPHPPSRHDRAIRGDLDVIVLKALQKDPGLRYQSATALQDDIERYLSNQPILARPPALTYVVRKMIQRHRTVCALATALVVLVVGSGIASTVQAVRLAGRTQALAAAREEAERTGEIAVAVNAFLHDMLAAADPETGTGQDVTVRYVLDQAAREIAHGALGDQPEVQAAVRHTLGNTYRALGRYPEAEAQLRRAVEIRQQLHPQDHPDLATSLHKLARVLDSTGEFAESERLCRAALDMRRRLFGDRHIDVAKSLNNLGWLRFQQGDYQEAERIQRQVLDLRHQLLGDRDPEIATAMNNLALTLHSMNRFDEAEDLLRRSLAMDQKLRAGPHPNIISTMNNLSGLLLVTGRLQEAEQLIRQAVEMRRALLPDRHPALATDLTTLGNVLRRQGRAGEAETVLREALSIQHTLGGSHPGTAATLNNLALVLSDQGDFDAAERLHREAADLQGAALGPAHPDTLVSRYHLAALFLRQERNQAALALLTEIVEAAASGELPRQHRGLFLKLHGECLTRLRRYGEAEAALLQAYDLLGDTRAARQTADLLARLYEDWDRPQDATAWRHRAGDPADGQ